MQIRKKWLNQFKSFLQTCLRILFGNFWLVNPRRHLGGHKVLKTFQNQSTDAWINIPT
jgi:hypothetical protein